MHDLPISDARHLLDCWGVAVDDIRVVANSQQPAVLPRLIVAEAAVHHRAAEQAIGNFRVEEFMTMQIICPPDMRTSMRMHWEDLGYE